MSIDFDTLLYGPVHSVLSVDAVITPITSASSATVAVIDKTSGVQLPGDGPGLETVVPGAVVRVSVLDAAGITRADLRRAALTMNGRTYRIESTRPRPTPSGESDGELLLILTED